MDQQSSTQCFLRPFIYVMGGVLPALILALLSLLFMLSMDFRGMLLSTAAWMGFCGLLMAAVYKPSKISALLRTAITVLLLLGLYAISPLLPDITSIFHPDFWFSAVVLCPALLAIHYIWQSAWISNTVERLILAITLLTIAVLPAP